MAWCGGQVKGQKIFYLCQKDASHIKGFSHGVLPQSFLVLIIQTTWGVGLLQSHISFSNHNLYCECLGCIFNKKNWPWTDTHIQGKCINFVESRWDQSGQSLLPSVRSRLTGYNSNGMTHIRFVAHPSATLWEKCACETPSKLEYWTKGSLRCSGCMLIVV